MVGYLPENEMIKILVIEPLDTMLVYITPLVHHVVHQLEIISNSGAIITAVSASSATCLLLDYADLVLCDAHGEALIMLWVFKALIKLRGQSANNVVYIPNLPSHPLLSLLMIKTLKLLHQDFSNHLFPPKASQET